MKRFLCIFCILLFASTVSLASSSVGKSMNKKFIIMSDDEIMEMYDLIMAQFERRGISQYSTEHGVTVPPGTYTIGVDIPEGTYRIEFPTDNEYVSGLIYLYDKSGELIKFYSAGKIVDVPEIGKIELLNGTTFELRDIMSVFYEYKGLSF